MQVKLFAANTEYRIAKITITEVPPGFFELFSSIDGSSSLGNLICHSLTKSSIFHLFLSLFRSVTWIL